MTAYTSYKCPFTSPKCSLIRRINIHSYVIWMPFTRTTHICSLERLTTRVAHSMQIASIGATLRSLSTVSSHAFPVSSCPICPRMRACMQTCFSFHLVLFTQFSSIFSNLHIIFFSINSEIKNNFDEFPKKNCYQLKWNVIFQIRFKLKNFQKFKFNSPWNFYLNYQLTFNFFWYFYICYFRWKNIKIKKLAKFRGKWEKTVMVKGWKLRRRRGKRTNDKESRILRFTSWPAGKLLLPPSYFIYSSFSSLLSFTALSLALAFFSP